MYKKFNHATTRKMITAFSSVFDNIHIDSNGRDVKIPLHYSQGEKFIQKLVAYPDEKNTIQPMAMPIMGFELSSMEIDPDRQTNKNNIIQLKSEDGLNKYTLNRLPVSWNFDLYLGVKQLSEGFQVVEQIVPNFAPFLNLRIKSVESLEIEDNIQLTLTSFSHDIVTDGSMEDIRLINFQFSFTMKGFLYPDVRVRQNIQDAVTNINNMSHSDYKKKFMNIKGVGVYMEDKINE